MMMKDYAKALSSRFRPPACVQAIGPWDLVRIVKG